MEEQTDACMVPRNFAFELRGEWLWNSDWRDSWRGSGRGIGAATHSNVGKSAAIGAGVGGTTGALYDVFGGSRRDRDYED